LTQIRDSALIAEFPILAEEQSQLPVLRLSARFLRLRRRELKVQRLPAAVRDLARRPGHNDHCGFQTIEG
jgi:hypothetical protein